MKMKLIIARKVETEVGVFGTRKWPIRDGGKTNPASDLNRTRTKYRQIVNPTH